MPKKNTTTSPAHDPFFLLPFRSSFASHKIHLYAIRFFSFVSYIHFVFHQLFLQAAPFHSRCRCCCCYFEWTQLDLIFIQLATKIYIDFSIVKKQQNHYHSFTWRNGKQLAVMKQKPIFQSENDEIFGKRIGIVCN